MDENYSKIVKHKLFWEIIKGRRSSIGNRWHSHLWVSKKETKTLFLPGFVYLNYIGPGDVAGNHYHKNLKEIFCPLGNLDLFLRDTKLNKTIHIKMSVGTKSKYIMYYITPMTPHAVVNNTKKFMPLVILTNKKDDHSDTYKYKVI